MYVVHPAVMELFLILSCRITIGKKQFHYLIWQRYYLASAIQNNFAIFMGFGHCRG